MAKLKIGSDVFLGEAEQNRLQKTLAEWGYKRNTLFETKEFGLVKDCEFPDLGVINREDCFLVEKAGTPVDEVKINPGLALNLDGDLIINSTLTNLVIPNDGLWYWLKISYLISHEEKGTVSIDTFGNLTGVGTEFTKIYRGQPNFASKIRFINTTSGNGDDYEIVKVISDTQAIVQGDFISETNLKHAVVGTYTPGYVVPTASELIFEYDSVKFDLIQETVTNTRPASIPNMEFYIARVRNTGITLQLEDKRVDWYKTQAENLATYLDRLSHVNPVIGIESIKYTSENSPKDKNEVNMAFGFRFASYTIDTSSKKISVLIGEGGIFKDTSYFNTGDFDLWRLYSKNGNYQTIIDSQQSGTQIVITLDALDPDEYGVSDMLFIAPPFEEIEFRFRNNSITPFPLMDKNFVYPINSPVVKCEIPTQDGCVLYNVNFRYKTFLGYTDWLALPDDPVGYYDETSFDKFGVLNPDPVDRVRFPYAGDLTAGFIKICEPSDSFQNFQEEVQTGDKIGVNTTALANSEPVVQLMVGQSKQYQHYKGALTFAQDIYINLNRQNAAGDFFREGNFFLLQFEQFINLATFKLRIVEDYVNPTSYTLIQELTANEIMFIRNQTINDPTQSQRRGLMVRCTFNELDHWIVEFESDVTPKGTIRMIADAPAGTFDGTGIGIKQGYWGWQVCNGNNGSIDMMNKFPMGVDQPDIGDTGGSEATLIDSTMLPDHTHTFNGTTAADTHTHNMYFRGVGTDVGAGNGDPQENRGTQSPPSGSTPPLANTHSHAFSGTTDPSGGTGTPDPVVTVPPYVGLLFIQKMV